MPECAAGHGAQRLGDHLPAHVGQVAAAADAGDRAGVRFAPSAGLQDGGYARFSDPRTLALDLRLDHLAW